MPVSEPVPIVVQSWMQYEIARGMQANESVRQQIEERLSELFSNQYRDQTNRFIGVLDTEQLNEVARNAAIASIIREIEQDEQMIHLREQHQLQALQGDELEAKQQQAEHAFIDSLNQQYAEQQQIQQRELEQQVEQSREAAKQAAAQAEQQAKQHQDSNRAALGQSQAELEQMRAEQARINAQIGELSTENTALDAQIAEKSQAIEGLNETISARATEIDQLKEEISEAQRIQPMLAQYDQTTQALQQVDGALNQALANNQRDNQQSAQLQQLAAQKQQAYQQTYIAYQNGQISEQACRAAYNDTAMTTQQAQMAHQQAVQSYAAIEPLYQEQQRLLQGQAQAKQALDANGEIDNLRQKVGALSNKQSELETKEAEQSLDTDKKATLSSEIEDLNRSKQDNLSKISSLQQKDQSLESRVKQQQELIRLQNQKQAQLDLRADNLNQQNKIHKKLDDLDDEISRLKSMDKPSLDTDMQDRLEEAQEERAEQIAKLKALDKQEQKISQQLNGINNEIEALSPSTQAEPQKQPKPTPPQPQPQKDPKLTATDEKTPTQQKQERISEKFMGNLKEISKDAKKLSKGNWDAQHAARALAEAIMLAIQLLMELLELLFKTVKNYTHDKGRDIGQRLQDRMDEKHPKLIESNADLKSKIDDLQDQLNQGIDHEGHELSDKAKDKLKDQQKDHLKAIHKNEKRMEKDKWEHKLAIPKKEKKQAKAHCKQAYNQWQQGDRSSPALRANYEQSMKDFKAKRAEVKSLKGQRKEALKLLEAKQKLEVKSLANSNELGRASNLDSSGYSDLQRRMQNGEPVGVSDLETVMDTYSNERNHIVASQGGQVAGMPNDMSSYATPHQNSQNANPAFVPGQDNQRQRSESLSISQTLRQERQGPAPNEPQRSRSNTLR